MLLTRFFMGLSAKIVRDEMGKRTFFDGRGFSVLMDLKQIRRNEIKIRCHRGMPGSFVWTWQHDRIPTCFRYFREIKKTKSGCTNQPPEG